MIIWRQRKLKERGSALLLVLALVVLTTALVLAFLSQALIQGNIGSSSSKQTGVEIFARGAMSTILGNLKLEITEGSISSTSTAGTTLYYPTSQWNAVPSLSGLAPGYTSLPPGLLKCSLYGAPIYGGNGFPSGNSTVVPASNVASSSVSLNGVTVTAPDWNQSLLLPKASLTGTDTTPATTGSTSPPGGSTIPPITWGFAVPDWILVARDGTNPTTFSQTSSAINGTNPVLGRYAYCIYGEDGLLNANEAGELSTDQTQTNEFPLKGGIALASLATAFEDPSVGMNTADATALADAIITWRNSYSLNNAPTAAWLSPDLTPLTKYLQNFFSNNTGYMTVNGPSVTPPGVSEVTDQAFVSRQALLQFVLYSSECSGIATLAERQNALQCLGTFSRSLEQPSIMPQNSAANTAFPHLPITSPQPSEPLASVTAIENYDGGNSASKSSETTANPAFPALLVTGAVSRTGWNNGIFGPYSDTSASATNPLPLVRTKFPLSRLAWITYQGPSASATPPGDPHGTAANIQACFGLTWVPCHSDLGGYWTYNQGFNDGNGNTVIGTLAQVQAQNREPDFFELLKATIAIGSLGKSSAQAHNVLGGGNFFPEYAQFIRDTSPDFQIVQIAANIIDQSDSDSFPTRIRVAVNDTAYPAASVPPQGNNYREFQGVEDLPYCYGMMSKNIILKSPSVPVNSWITTLPSTTAGAEAAIGYPGKWDPGYQAVMLQPLIWNPHAGSIGPETLQPTQFRACLVPVDPNLDYPPQGQQDHTFAQSNPVNGTYESDSYNMFCLPNNSTLCFCNTATRVSNLQSHYNMFFVTPPYLGGTSSSTATDGLDPWDNVAKIKAYNGGYTWNSILFDTKNTSYRTPTLLDVVNAANSDANDQYSWGLGYYPDGTFWYFTNPGGVADVAGTKYVGFYISDAPLVSLYQAPSSTNPNPNPWLMVAYQNEVLDAGEYYVRLQYLNTTVTPNVWVTYSTQSALDQSSSIAGNVDWTTKGVNSTLGAPTVSVPPIWMASCDPRTTRFGVMGSTLNGSGTESVSSQPIGSSLYTSFWADASIPGTISGVTSSRPSSSNSNPCGFQDIGPFEFDLIGGWYYKGPLGNTGGSGTPPPTSKSNNTSLAPYFFEPGSTATNSKNDTTYYSDPDGIVRRAEGASVVDSSLATTGKTEGQPMYAPAATLSPSNRPVILNRPFRSVAELGCVFRDTPWKNLDLTYPESGDSGLLDVFCIDEPPQTALSSGKINPNFAAPRVIQAVLTGVGMDNTSSASTPALSTADQQLIANAWYDRVNQSNANLWQGPAANLSELVGRIVSPSVTVPANTPDVYDASPLATGTQFNYTGFPAQLSSLGLSSAFKLDLPRYRQSVLRGLTDSSQVRVWNLLIDLYAQVGRYPSSASDGTQFVVEGQTHYWVHVAIDRLTRQIVDQQVEEVSQ